MADRLSKKQRSINMSHIKNRDTIIEVKVRKFLFHSGFRYRKNDKRYPGIPDIVLPKYKTVIFVNGCFWHQHQNCKRATLPETKRDFWKRKLSGNSVNDKFNKEHLERMGWYVIVVWQCELEKDFNGIMHRIVDIISSRVKK